MRVVSTRKRLTLVTKQKLPPKMQRRFNVETVDEMWSLLLEQGNTFLRRKRHLYGRLPSNPRCVNCHRPFAGPGGGLLRVIQRVQRSDKNPRFCAGCHSFTSRFPGGAEVELTMLFVDVRGSTQLAERMEDDAFSELMNRFYEAAITVLVRADAFIDKLVGDEVTALFIPGYAGKDHAQKAVKAGRSLLAATGYTNPHGPWIPVGVGIHTGEAWVGSIAGASGTAADFTALGDNVNVAARLASKAAGGEIVISEDTYRAAGLDDDNLEQRELELKGKSQPVEARILDAG
jgi:adenylate cyclase